MNKTHNSTNYPKHIRQLKSSRSRAWRVQKNNSDNSNLVENYKRLSNKYRAALCAHELDCERKVTEAGNLGTFYKFVNKKLTHPSGIGVLYDTNNKPIINDQHKAELLNSYSESVYVDDDGITPRCERKVSVDTKIVTVKFEPDIIYNIIRQLKPKTTCDPEGFSPLLIKLLISSIAYPLALIFDSFMSVSKVPSSWKKAIITPIFKKGLPSDPRNYRPVSLTTVFGKVMERVIIKELLSHLEHYRLIGGSQHGFLKRLSTCTNLLEFVNDWTILLEGGSKVAVAYIDYSRAFDCVSHSKLIQKLESYGISDSLLDFISFYLCNRTHCTRVGTEVSSDLKIRSGVIQGSCLGPILFVLFVNDITDALNRDTTAKLYADDLKLYATIDIDDTDTNSLQQSLKV